MIKFIGITDIIDFDKDYKEDWTTEIRIALKVTDKDIIKKAKKIDKEYFNKKCFGLNFNYVHSENKMYVLGEGFYYVDNGGDDNYIKIDKDIVKELQDITETEYLKYLDNREEYLKNCEYNIIEDEI